MRLCPDRVVCGAARRRRCCRRSSRRGSPAPRAPRKIEIGGKWVTEKTPERPRAPGLQGRQVGDDQYGRPLKRGRELFGTGDAYATKLNAGAPVWRAGANVSTRLKTEAPLVIGGKTLAPGEYTLFIDLKPRRLDADRLHPEGAAELRPEQQGPRSGAPTATTPRTTWSACRCSVAAIPFSVEQLT